VFIEIGCAHVFIKNEYSYVYKYLYLYCVSKKIPLRSVTDRYDRVVFLLQPSGERE
jgi:hypothetical protein